MPPNAIGPPEADEHAPYFGRYISLVQERDILATLKGQHASTLSYLRTISESKGGFRYAAEKWSIKEVIAHVTDSERVFAYRALSISRNDPAHLPSFEQDDWMKALSVNAISLRDLTDEFDFVRKSNIALFEHLSMDSWMRRGTAGGNPVSVRALAYIIAGHELHHVRILKEKYVS